jgi:rfaE bifunctional protein nucleotidyltransferase chain/domain
MDSFVETSGKIFTADLLRQQVEIWRAQGLTLVVTNGCFDLLHAGHIATLEAARTYGNVLIVGVNSDDSIRSLKGSDRPLNNQDDRARVIAALACVDAVTIFNEITAECLLDLVRPHVYVKGGDYNPETLPEYPVIRRYGGKMVFIPLVDGHSTTNLIHTCRK